MFTIDGVNWPYPCGIERTAELKQGDASGMLLDRSQYNDVLGTYMRYTVSVAVPMDQMARYTALYEALTDPAGEHQFTFPYNQSTIDLTGCVGNVEDVYVRLPNGGVYWKGLRFTISANHPSRYYTAQQLSQRGQTALPDVVEPQEGDTYTFHNGEWVAYTGE